MNPRVMVSVITDKEICSFDDESSGVAIIEAIKTMRGGDRILDEIARHIYVTVIFPKIQEVYNDHRGQKDTR